MVLCLKWALGLQQNYELLEGTNQLTYFWNFPQHLTLQQTHIDALYILVELKYKMKPGPPFPVWQIYSIAPYKRIINMGH